MSATPLKCVDGMDHDFTKHVPTIVEGEEVGTDIVCSRCGVSVEAHYRAEIANDPLDVMVHAPNGTSYWACKDGACPECRKWEGRYYESSCTPELPPEGCTCEGECRSYYILVPFPVVWWKGQDPLGIMRCKNGKDHVFSELREDLTDEMWAEDAYRCFGCGQSVSEVVAAAKKARLAQIQVAARPSE